MTDQIQDGEMDQSISESQSGKRKGLNIGRGQLIKKGVAGIGKIGGKVSSALRNDQTPQTPDLINSMQENQNEQPEESKSVIQNTIGVVSGTKNALGNGL